MTIYFACDHGGFELKSNILHELSQSSFPNLDHRIEDLGCYSTDSVNYPDYATQLCIKIENDNADLYKHHNHKSIDALTGSLGVLICGSGQGMAMKANKFSFVRAALVWSEEIARLSREHNNANIICLPGRFMNTQQALTVLRTFLTTSFAQGRHANRVENI